MPEWRSCPNQAERQRPAASRPRSLLVATRDPCSSPPPGGPLRRASSNLLTVHVTPTHSLGQCLPGKPLARCKDFIGKRRLAQRAREGQAAGCQRDDRERSLSSLGVLVRLYPDH